MSSDLWGFPKPFVVFMGGLFACLIGATASAIFGAWWLAPFFGMLGPFLWIGVAMAYAVFIDSRKRWPDVSPWVRYVRLVTFYREP